MRLIATLLAVACLMVAVHADVYMHNPRGNNDRNCERNANRQNANRLFDSQNNAAGGYACPRAENPAVPVGTMYYYEGSILPIEWTNQHGGGDNPKVHTDIVIQYMCGDDVRDGTPRNQNDDATDTVPDNRQQSQNQRFGVNESYDSYQACKGRARNRGLYTADQNINKAGSIGTRQNPNGNRYGFECPEERDYYPYWAPTEWIDVAVITSTPERCPQIIADSQNVKPRGYCEKNNGNDNNGETPNNEAECTAKTGYTWKVAPAHNKPAPQCISGNEFYSRNNHLGNGEGAVAVTYNWTIPSSQGIADKNCVVRVRYNITTLDNQNNAGFPDARRFIDDVSAQAMDMMMLATPGANGKNISAVGNGAKVNRDRVWTAEFGTRSSTVGRVEFEVYNANGDRIHRQTERKAPFSLAGDGNALRRFEVGKTYKVVAQPYSRSGNPGQKWEATVEIVDGQEDYGTDGVRTPAAISPYNHVPQDPYVYIGDDEDQFLALAINTNQYARTFQDRSYVFNVKPRPAGISASDKIWNLNVRGKRGNIVQVYPSVEYDFVPNALEAKTGDFIHFQWTGSDRNPQRGPNDGEGGPGANGNPNANSRADRSNFVQMSHISTNFPSVKADLESSTLFVTDNGSPDWNTIYKLAFINQGKCKTLQQLLNLNAGNRRDNDDENCSKLSAAKAPYFDGGLVKMRKSGTASYYSTRNNNFTNREQKATIRVVDAYAPPPPLPMWPLHSSVENARIGDTTGEAKHYITMPSGQVKVSWHQDPAVRFYYVLMVNQGDPSQVVQEVMRAGDICQNNQCSYTRTQAMAAGMWGYTVYGADGAWSKPSKTNYFGVA